MDTNRVVRLRVFERANVASPLLREAFFWTEDKAKAAAQSIGLPVDAKWVHSPRGIVGAIHESRAYYLDNVEVQ